MPRRKSDREKKMGGTFRPDRAAREAPKAVPEARATLTTITVKLADAQKQLAGLKGRENVKARARVENNIRILTDDVELAMEALNKAMNHAAQQAAAPSIRPGLSLMSAYDCYIAQPPLSADEQDAFDFIVLDGRNCPCGAGINAPVVLGKNKGDDWEFCSVCKQPLPWGRRNIAAEKKAAREGADRYIEIQQKAVDAVNAQRKKDA